MKSLCRYLTLAILAFSVSAFAASFTWAPYKNPSFGFEVYVPSQFVGLSPIEEHGRTFISEDGQAQVAAYAMLDPAAWGSKYYMEKVIQATGRLSPEIAEQIAPHEANPYGDLIDTQMSDSSILFIGKRGHRKFYNFLLFSCRDKVVNVLSYSFEESQASIYEPLFAKIQRKFSAGSGAKTPICSD